jgi:hypothetical protein
LNARAKGSIFEISWEKKSNTISFFFYFFPHLFVPISMSHC